MRTAEAGADSAAGARPAGKGRTPGGARSAQDVLAWSRGLTAPALRAAVDGLPGSLRRLAGYHFGWWDERGTPTEADSGKALRPALVLLSASAIGGAPAGAVPAAVAVELVHNFSLLHDDVMDGDATRRHRPTAWAVFGVNAAILAGDALLTLAFDVLAHSGHPAVPEAGRALGAAVVDLLAGQSVDLAFEERAEVGLAECVGMAAAKTGALLGCSAGLGAMFAGGRPDRVGHVTEFGRQLGLAFQYVDDLLGIWGDPLVTGKPVHSDLTSRKKSLPVVAALGTGTPAGRELAALYCDDRPLAGADLARAAKLIELTGARNWCRAEADRLLVSALGSLVQARPATRARAELTNLARLAVRRDR